MTNPFIIGKLRVPSLTTTFYTQVPNKVVRAVALPPYLTQLYLNFPSETRYPTCPH